MSYLITLDIDLIKTGYNYVEWCSGWLQVTIKTRINQFKNCKNKQLVPNKHRITGDVYYMHMQMLSCRSDYSTR